MLFAAWLVFRPPPFSLFQQDRLSCPGLWVACRPRCDGVILYFHGGAYVLGSPRTHRAMAAELAARSGCRVFLPRYRLAPENPFPAAFEDALGVWEALLARGYPAGRIVLGGDSAGGGLALALLGHLCRAGTPPAGAFAFSPWTDLTLSGASVIGNARRDRVLPAGRLAEARGMVLGFDGGLGPAPVVAPQTPDAALDPRLSPLFAAFPDPPPVLIHAAESEILRDDTLRMSGPLPGARLRLAGDLPHVWPILHGFLPEARATLDETATFIRACLGSAPAGS